MHGESSSATSDDEKISTRPSWPSPAWSPTVPPNGNPTPANPPGQHGPPLIAHYAVTSGSIVSRASSDEPGPGLRHEPVGLALGEGQHTAQGLGHPGPVEEVVVFLQAREIADPPLDLTGLLQHGVDHLKRHLLGQLAESYTG
jgi:hypothetical protein